MEIHPYLDFFSRGIVERRKDDLRVLLCIAAGYRRSHSYPDIAVFRLARLEQPKVERDFSLAPRRYSKEHVSFGPAQDGNYSFA